MKIKIELDKGQAPEEAEELLYKALTAKRSVDVHTEEFQDPVMEEAAQKMVNMHKQIWEESLEEILSILDEEYE